jgi:uncharacterized protein
MPKNSVSHFEIYADDAAKLKDFYTTLFDWNIQEIPQMDYSFVTTTDTDEQGKPTEAGGINGGFMKRPKGYEGRAWVNYVTVDSVDAMLERAKKLGAQVTKGKSAVPGMGWFAMMLDLEGNPFAVWQPDRNAG